jgi:hypothetical protein
MFFFPSCEKWGGHTREDTNAAKIRNKIIIGPWKYDEYLLVKYSSAPSHRVQMPYGFSLPIRYSSSLYFCNFTTAYPGEEGRGGGITCCTT